MQRLTTVGGIQLIMPVCNTCGGKDHVEEDGLLYCAECGTQCDVSIFTNVQ